MDGWWLVLAALAGVLGSRWGRFRRATRWVETERARALARQDIFRRGTKLHVKVVVEGEGRPCLGSAEGERGGIVGGGSMVEPETDVVVETDGKLRYRIPARGVIQFAFADPRIVLVPRAAETWRFDLWLPEDFWFWLLAAEPPASPPDEPYRTREVPPPLAPLPTVHSWEVAWFPASDREDSPAFTPTPPPLPRWGFGWSVLGACMALGLGYDSMTRMVIAAAAYALCFGLVEAFRWGDTEAFVWSDTPPS